MALGLSLVLGALVSGALVLIGAMWIVRSIRTGEFGLFGPGLAPSIRQARQPVKFWAAITILAVLLLLPLMFAAFVVRQVLS